MVSGSFAIWLIEDILPDYSGALIENIGFDSQEVGELVLFLLVNDWLRRVTQACKLDLMDGLRHVPRALYTIPVHFQNLIVAPLLC